MAIVEQAAAEEAAGSVAAPAGPLGILGPLGPLGPLTSPPANVLRQGWRSIADLLADQRERRSAAAHAPPPEGLPLAVDIIRADRDSR